LLSLKKIVQIEKPERIIVLSNVGITNYIIINSIADFFNIEVVRNVENFTKGISKYKNIIKNFQLLIERLWYWKIWKIFNKKLIRLNRFRNEKDKVIYYAHYKNIYPTLVQILKTLKETKEITNIIYVPHKLKEYALNIIEKEKLQNIEVLLYSDRNYSSFKRRYNLYKSLVFKITKSDSFAHIKAASISVSNLIKVALLNLHEKYVNSLKYLENITYTTNRIKPKLIVMLSGNDIVDELGVRIAKRNHIPTLYVPHSIMALTHERAFLQQDFVGCAGQHKKELFKSWGMDERSLKFIGIPLYDKLYHKLETITNFDEIQEKVITEFNIKPSNKVILLVTSHHEDYMRELIFTSVLNVVNQHPDIQLIIKIHPVEEKHFYRDIMKKMGETELNIVKKKDLHELIIASDLVIGSNTGAQIEALLLERKVINLNYMTIVDMHLMAKFEAVLNVLNPEHLEEAIQKALYDSKTEEFLKQGRKKYIEYVLYKFDGKASIRVKELVDKVLKKG
jgi:hypothetical protein